MARLVGKSRTTDTNDTCFDEIGLCVQNIDTISHSF